MTLRSALRTNTLLVIGVLLIGGWLLLNVLQVVETMGSFDLGSQVIGQGGTSGVIGVLVMAVFAVLLLYLYSEIGRSDPSPEPFPPRHDSTDRSRSSTDDQH
ncbi:hypothetical protein BRC77_15425 [Halobacteriales archaeon QH_8_64_26]|nr:MAG: hypothetical protein BRC77_15425 [Halobacteriales archaeon QH_8_64_26]